MPIYQYQCNSCGKITDEITTVNDMKVNTVCSFCKHTAFRIVTAPGYVKMAPKIKWPEGQLRITSSDPETEGVHPEDRTRKVQL